MLRRPPSEPHFRPPDAPGIQTEPLPESRVTGVRDTLVSADDYAVACAALTRNGITFSASAMAR